MRPEMPPCRRNCPGPAGPVAHSRRPEPPAPQDEPDFSTGCSPWPHPTTALTRPTTTTANFAQSQSRHSHCSNPHQPSHSHTFPLHLTQNTAATVSSSAPTSTPPSRPSLRGVSPGPPTATTSRTPPIHL